MTTTSSTNMLLKAVLERELQYAYMLLDKQIKSEINEQDLVVVTTYLKERIKAVS